MCMSGCLAPRSRTSSLDPRLQNQSLFRQATARSSGLSPSRTSPTHRGRSSPGTVPDTNFCRAAASVSSRAHVYAWTHTAFKLLHVRWIARCGRPSRVRTCTNDLNSLDTRCHRGRSSAATSASASVCPSAPVVNVGPAVGDGVQWCCTRRRRGKSADTHTANSPSAPSSSRRRPASELARGSAVAVADTVRARMYRGERRGVDVGERDVCPLEMREAREGEQTCYGHGGPVCRELGADPPERM
ncbi:hypothetical protein C8Q80DRAFT_307134 [Daedaleopsis nitida]|nr:hypothetical protein C8Q80DRAFT_307134 [Daedaleopsis nitida]